MEYWNINRIVNEFTLNNKFVFFDIGANKGQELDILVPTGIQIHSFEPHPKFAERIKERFKEKTNLIFNKTAAWIKNEQKKFYYKRDPELQWDKDGGSTLLKEKSNINKHWSVDVQCIDISDYIFSLNKSIDIIKLDVEGVEYHIIKHLITTGAVDMVKNIFFEDHSRKMPSTFLEFHDNKRFVFNNINKLKTRFGYW